PATAEVINVAAFTLHTTTAATVEDLTFALYFCNQLHPGFLLGNSDVRIVAVAQDIDVEMGGVTGRLNGLPGCAQPREYAVNVFVTDRHNQRRAVLRIQGFIPDRRRRNAVFVSSHQQLQEAHQRGPETGRDPAEENGEQQKNAT